MKIQLSAKAVYVNGSEMNVTKEAIAKQLKYMLFGIPVDG